MLTKSKTRKKIFISPEIKPQPELIYSRVCTPEFYQHQVGRSVWDSKNQCYALWTIKEGTINTDTWDFTVAIHDGKLTRQPWPIMFRTEEDYLRYRI